MVLATIDSHSQNTLRFTKSPSLVFIGLVLTEIQAFKNVKKLQRNVVEKRTNPDITSRYEIRQLGLPVISLLRLLQHLRPSQ